MTRASSLTMDGMTVQKIKVADLDPIEPAPVLYLRKRRIGWSWRITRRHDDGAGGTFETETPTFWAITRERAIRRVVRSISTRIVWVEGLE